MMTMPRTREELERAAAETEAWLDSLDPDKTPAEDARLYPNLGFDRTRGGCRA